MSQNGKGFCMRYLILLALAAVLLFSGCIQQPATPAPTTPEITCPTNYMKIGNACCLDANGNGICDRDEQAPPVQQNATACPPQNKTLEDRFKDCDYDADCLTRLALETNNAGVCGGYGGGLDCLNQMAVRYNNPGYCNLIIGPTLQQSCLAKLNSTNSS